MVSRAWSPRSRWHDGLPSMRRAGVHQRHSSFPRNWRGQLTRPAEERAHCPANDCGHWRGERIGKVERRRRSRDSRFAIAARRLGQNLRRRQSHDYAGSKRPAMAQRPMSPASAHRNLPPAHRPPLTLAVRAERLSVRRRDRQPLAGPATQFDSMAAVSAECLGVDETLGKIARRCVCAGGRLEVRSRALFHARLLPCLSVVRRGLRWPDFSGHHRDNFPARRWPVFSGRPG